MQRGRRFYLILCSKPWTLRARVGNGFLKKNPEIIQEDARNTNVIAVGVADIGTGHPGNKS